MQIIAPEQFKILPWKNGKGTTTELAISSEGTMENFDWRLSIATVSEDGPFSNFAGIERNLILIEGSGIQLTHDHQKVDSLNNNLDFATFDGGSFTAGTLINGSIKDFNLMHNPDRFEAKVITIKQSKSIRVQPSDWCFIYGLKTAFKITIESDAENNNATVIDIDPKHLVILDNTDTKSFSVSGEQLIVLQLTPLTHKCSD